MLIGLDALDRNGLYVNNVRNLLIHDSAGWGVNLRRKHGHVHHEWPDEVLFTLAELKQMHCGFYHPSVYKLFNLIKRADPDSATMQTRKLLEEISQQCRNCQFHAPRPLKFFATIPDGIAFNRQVILDLMWICRKSVLHVIDADTHYSAARFLLGESTKDVWNAFIECWASVYLGFPDILKADRGSVFTSRAWSKLSTEDGMAIEIVPVESSNSMGAGERYHDPLCCIYLEVMFDHSGSSKELLLALTNKAMNDNCGPEGLVPSFLVYGIVPRLPAASFELPDQDVRMSMLETARKEMEEIVTRLRLKTVLKRRAPASAYAVLSEGDPVLVWQKLSNESVPKWTGPFQVLKNEG